MQDLPCWAAPLKRPSLLFESPELLVPPGEPALSCGVYLNLSGRSSPFFSTVDNVTFRRSAPHMKPISSPSASSIQIFESAEVPISCAALTEAGFWYDPCGVKVCHTCSPICPRPKRRMAGAETPGMPARFARLCERRKSERWEEKRGREGRNEEDEERWWGLWLVLVI